MGKASVQPLTPGGESYIKADGTEGYAYERPEDSVMGKQFASDQAAHAQTEAANRPDQQSNFANTNWYQDPQGGWHQNTALNGALGGASTDLQKQYADMLAKPMGDGSDARNQAINAAYGQATSRLDPQWDKRQEAERTQLLNQGLDPSSQAYQSAMQDFGLQRNDAYSSAMNNAIGQGTAAGNQVFQNNMALREGDLAQMAAMQGLTKPAGFVTSGAAPSEQWINATNDTNNAEIGKTNQNNQVVSDSVNGAGQAAASVATIFAA